MGLVSTCTELTHMHSDLWKPQCLNPFVNYERGQGIQESEEKSTSLTSRESHQLNKIYFMKKFQEGGGNLFSCLYFFPKSDKKAVKRTVQK